MSGEIMQRRIDDVRRSTVIGGEEVQLLMVIGGHF